MNSANNYARQLRLCVRIFFTGILFFTAFRLFNLIYNADAFASMGPHKLALIIHSFWVGFQYDAWVCTFILFAPFTVGLAASVAGKLSKNLLGVLYGFVNIAFLFSFLVCAADIPFFKYFRKRLNDTIFNWNNAGGFGVKMIAQNLAFGLFLLVFFGLAFLLLRIMRGHYRKHVALLSAEKPRPQVSLAVLLLPVAVLFAGMRSSGTDKASGLTTGAYFSHNIFADQLSFNPVYTFAGAVLSRYNPRSAANNFMSMHEAEAVVSADFHGQESLRHLSPVARHQISSGKFAGRNVVLVIMESMAAYRMERYGNRDRLTPFLDSLAAQSICFDSTFSAGIHTYNGIYSTLFGMPAPLKKHTMDLPKIPHMNGLASVLRARDYQTIFFTTHDERFDNMSAFLSANGFQKIVGEKDYPQSEIRSTLGVPDAYLFHNAMPMLNTLHESGKPFLATFMTGSNHAPYIVPEDGGFKRRNKATEKAIVEYADWSVAQFMHEAAQQSWYDSSIFVFVADHGVPLWDDLYESPLSFQHIPFFIFIPKGGTALADKKLAVQNDVTPTVLGLVTEQYLNTMYGIDLLHERHEKIVFTSDDIISCMNDSLLYVWHIDGRAPTLYKYRSRADRKDYARLLPTECDRLERSAFGLLQCAAQLR